MAQGVGALPQNGIHLLVAGAAPYFPEGRLGEPRALRVGIAQRREQQGFIGRLAHLAKFDDGLPAQIHFHMAQVGERLLALGAFNQFHGAGAECPGKHKGNTPASR